ALLGDRVRMQDHATDPGVFIRSMASRGHLGGLAAATPQALRVLDAAGFGAVLVETVGVGQAEVEVASLADTTLVLVAPGTGDAVQAAKAGILEVGDIFVVNKCDSPSAQETVRNLRTMIAMAERGEGDWKPPIVMTTATTGEGIADLTAALDAHWSWLDSSGERDRRRRARAREEVAAVAVAALRQRMGGLPGDSRLDELAARVAAGELDPYSAADELVAATVPISGRPGSGSRIAWAPSLPQCSYAAGTPAPGGTGTASGPQARISRAGAADLGGRAGTLRPAPARCVRPAPVPAKCPRNPHLLLPCRKT